MDLLEFRKIHKDIDNRTFLLAVEDLKKEILAKMPNTPIEVVDNSAKTWKPKYDESYWFINLEGEVRPEVWNDTRYDNYLLSVGNVFKSKDDHKIGEYKQALINLKKRFFQ